MSNLPSRILLPRWQWKYIDSMSWKFLLRSRFIFLRKLHLYSWLLALLSHRVHAVFAWASLSLRRAESVRRKRLLSTWLYRHIRMHLQPRLCIFIDNNHELRRCKWHMHRVRGGLQMRWEWRRGGCVHLLCGLRLDVDYIKRLCHYHVNVRGDRLWCRKPVCGWVSAACRVYMQPGLFIVVDDNHELLRYN